jgi:histidinol dehydrogenase
MRVKRERNAWYRRGLAPAVAEQVTEIIDEVREGGDSAVIRLTERFDKAELGPGQLRVEPRELDASLGVLEPEVLRGLRTAVANVRAVADAQLREPVSVEPGEGQRIELVEVPVRRAGIYVPGGRAPYPSTVVMCAATARTAGVEQVAVCAPPGPGGRAHPAVLAACVLCEVNEVYRMGGAQAIAALAYGTESVEAVDVIAGPGNAYVQEAKRQVVGRVGIDGIAGPSELVVVATAGAEPELVALDLLAQAEHGEDSPLWLISPDRALLEAIIGAVERLAPERPTVADAELQVIEAGDVRRALELAEEIAPEHLELVGEDAEELAGRVRRAGCMFVGRGAATAFGDYVAGSNHVLPTGGAARFQSALSVSTFRRRMARVSLPGEAPARLAPAGAALARAEGFPVHAESMERRGIETLRRRAEPSEG